MNTVDCEWLDKDTGRCKALGFSYRRGVVEIHPRYRNDETRQCTQPDVALRVRCGKDFNKRASASPKP